MFWDLMQVLSQQYFTDNCLYSRTCVIDFFHMLLAL
jgi:hypothetical protein